MHLGGIKSAAALDEGAGQHQTSHQLAGSSTHAVHHAAAAANSSDATSCSPAAASTSLQQPGPDGEAAALQPPAHLASTAAAPLAAAPPAAAAPPQCREGRGVKFAAPSTDGSGDHQGRPAAGSVRQAVPPGDQQGSDASGLLSVTARSGSGFFSSFTRAHKVRTLAFPATPPAHGPACVHDAHAWCTADCCSVASSVDADAAVRLGCRFRVRELLLAG